MLNDRFNQNILVFAKFKEEIKYFFHSNCTAQLFHVHTQLKIVFFPTIKFFQLAVQQIAGKVMKSAVCLKLLILSLSMSRLNINGQVSVI